MRRVFFPLLGHCFEMRKHVEQADVKNSPEVGTDEVAKYLQHTSQKRCKSLRGRGEKFVLSCEFRFCSTMRPDGGDVCDVLQGATLDEHM